MDIKVKGLTIQIEQTLDRSRDFKNDSPYKRVTTGHLNTDVRIETTMGTVLCEQKLDIEKLPALMLEDLIRVYTNIETYIENNVSIKSDELDEFLDDRDIQIKKNSNPNFEYMSLIDPEANEVRRTEALEKIKPVIKEAPLLDKVGVQKKSILNMTEEEKNALYMSLDVKKSQRASSLV